MTGEIGTAMYDINSSIIGIILTPKRHASLLITQKLPLYNSWKSRMHLQVGTWAKGVTLNQSSKSLAVNWYLCECCTGEETIERSGPLPLYFRMR